MLPGSQLHVASQVSKATEASDPTVNHLPVGACGAFLAPEGSQQFAPVVSSCWKTCNMMMNMGYCRSPMLLHLLVPVQIYMAWQSWMLVSLSLYQLIPNHPVVVWLLQVATASATAGSVRIRLCAVLLFNGISRWSALQYCPEVLCHLYCSRYPMLLPLLVVPVQICMAWPYWMPASRSTSGWSHTGQPALWR